MEDEYGINRVTEESESHSAKPQSEDRRQLSPITIQISSVADRLKSLAECLYEITGDRDRITYLALAAECVEISELLLELRIDIRERALRE